MCNGPLIVSGHGRLNNEVIKLGLENVFAVNTAPLQTSFSTMPQSKTLGTESASYQAVDTLNIL